MNKAKFILTGTYSSYNKGDAAMQLSMASSLKDEWPKSDIMISSPFPNVDKNLYKEYSVIKSSRRNLFHGTLQVIRAWIFTLLKQKLNKTLSFLISNEELRYFEEANAVIDLSGDTITEDYGPHVTYSHLLPIMLGIAFRKPVFICAQSIGPFRLTKRLVKFVLNKTTLITARENITYQYLLDIGVRKDKLALTADMAFLLRPANKERVQKIIEKESLPFKNGPVLGITVSRIVESRYNSSGGNFVNEFARLLDKIKTESDINVLFIGHVTGPVDSKDDRIISKEIVRSMNKSNGTYVLNGDYRPDEIKGIIDFCTVFVGSRMHSNIGALSSTVPTSAIGYSHKTAGIMSLFNMGELVCDIDNLDFNKLYNNIKYTLDYQQVIRKELSNRIISVKEMSSKNLLLLKKALNEQ